MYIAPEIIVINANQLSEYIKVSAKSMCPGASADYTVGGGCGYLYHEGGCTAAHNCDAGHY